MTKIKLIFYDSLPNESILNTENAYVKNKISSIKNDARRTCSIIAYNLLDKLMLEHSGHSLDEYTIKENEYGKPHFTDSELYFNISHSENAIACAISDNIIGIDIERINDIKPRILEKCFNADEAATISEPLDFYRLWTLKEAYVKARGLGISKRLSNINFKLDKSIICDDNGSYSPYTFFTGEAFGYAYSICSEKTIKSSDINIEKV